MLRAILSCFQHYLYYLAAWFVFIAIIGRWLRPGGEGFRKLLHTIAYTSPLCLMAVSDNWQTPTLCCIIFAIVVYPLLLLAERLEGFDRFFTQRRPGEVKRSLLLLLLPNVLWIPLYWGLFDKPWIIYTSVLMWGTGDTAAALIGKRWGKHHVNLPLADPKKTWEGSAAMTMTALLAGLCALRLTSPYSIPLCLLLAALTAPVAAYTELITKNGNDTVTVPAAASVLLLILSCFI